MSNKIQLNNNRNRAVIEVIKSLENSLKRTKDDLDHLDFQIKNGIFPFTLNNGNLVLDPDTWNISNIPKMRLMIADSYKDLWESEMVIKKLLVIC